MKKKRSRIVKDRTKQASPLESLPLPKTQEELFWEQVKLLRSRASAGDEMALQRVFCLAVDSLSHLIGIWRNKQDKKALAQAIFVIKDALDSLEPDIQNPPKALLDLARKSHVWPVLVNPHPDEIQAVTATVRKTLKVGAETGLNYYGRKKLKFPPRKKIAYGLWEKIDICRCGIDERLDVSTESWRKDAVKLRPSSREKQNFEAWWEVAWKLFLEKYESNEIPYEENKTIRKVFANECKGLSSYKNIAGWKAKTNLRNRIATALRQEFETIMPLR